MTVVHQLGADRDHWLCGQSKGYFDLCIYGPYIALKEGEAPPCPACVAALEETYRRGHELTDIMADLDRSRYFVNLAQSRFREWLDKQPQNVTTGTMTVEGVPATGWALTTPMKDLLDKQP